MLVVFLLMSFAFSLILGVGASPAYAATHVGTTTYTSNVTWTLTNSPYVLDGDVTVAGGATLTIEPGVIVKLNGTLRSIWVSGTLQALGTSGAHITFTSLQDDAVGGDTGGDGTTSGSPGQWGAIKLQSATGAATFDHVDVRYGAYGSTPTSGGAIQTSNASESLTISHSTVRWSQSSGIYLFLGPATIDSTTISDGGNGVSINTAYAKIRNLSKITNNISDGVWVSLGAGTPAPTTVTNSDLTNNGRYGIYIIAGNQPLSLIPRGAMNNIYGNASKQLFISANPAFKNVELNWHYNYWGDVYYYFNDKSCLGTSPYSVGRIAYRSSTSSPPDGPMNGDTYLLLVNPPIVCAYDPFKNDPSTILAAPLHDGKPVTTLDETFGGCDGPGMADPAINASSCESDPVTGATGNFAKRETDLRLSGIGVPFQVTRTYNSLDPTVGPLGRGWSHSLSASLTIGSNGDVELHSDTGQGLGSSSRSRPTEHSWRTPADARR